jgi:hypothetical protein
MQETKINLSEYQIKKIKTAWKNKTSATIRLSYENISGTGKYKLLLTDDQNRLLDKSRKLKKGVTL